MSCSKPQVSPRISESNFPEPRIRIPQLQFHPALSLLPTPYNTVQFSSGVQYPPTTYTSEQYQQLELRTASNMAEAATTTNTSEQYQQLEQHSAANMAEATITTKTVHKSEQHQQPQQHITPVKAEAATTPPDTKPAQSASSKAHRTKKSKKGRRARQRPRGPDGRFITQAEAQQLPETGSTGTKRKRDVGGGDEKQPRRKKGRTTMTWREARLRRMMKRGPTMTWEEFQRRRITRSMVPKTVLASEELIGLSDRGGYDPDDIRCPMSWSDLDD